MKISQEEIESRQVTLNIEMESQDMDGYLDRAYRRLVQRLRIPGFRKGKAPRLVVERYVGHEGLLNEALDFMVPEITGKAIQQEALEPAGQPSIELIGVEPLKIKAIVPLSPIVEVGAYRELRLESDSTEVTDDQVDEVLQRLRLELAPWEPVERPVQFDDLVTLDLKGEADSRSVVDDRELAFIPRKDFDVPMVGFSEELVGMEIGEVKEFTLPFTHDYSDDTLQGKECTFTAKALELKEKNLPALDNEFAKGVGEGYESLEALKEKFRADLLEENIREKQRQLEERIIDAVVEGTHFELAPMMVDHEVDHLLQQETDALERQQIPLDDYLANVGKTTEQLREDLREPSVRRLQRSLALVKVAELENIEIGPEDIQEEINNLAGGSGEQADAIRQIFDTENGRESIGRRLLTRRTLDSLIAISKGESMVSQAGSENTENETTSNNTKRKKKKGEKNAG